MIEQGALTQRDGASIGQERVQIQLDVVRLKGLRGCEAFEAQFKAFCEAFKKSFPEEELIDPSDLRESLQEMKYFDIWVIRNHRSGQVVAGAITNLVESNRELFGWLPYLFTDEESRRQGVGRRVDQMICAEAAAQGAVGQFLEIVDPTRISDDQRAEEISFYSHGEGEPVFTPDGRSEFWVACGYKRVGMHYISVGYETPYALMFKYLSPERIGAQAISAQSVGEAILDNLAWMDMPEADPQYIDMMAMNGGKNAYQLLSGVLTPTRLLHVEPVGKENLDTAMEVLFSAFPDEQSQAHIRYVFDAFVNGSVDHPSLAYPDGNIQIKDQYLYRDHEGTPVAVGGLYKELKRPVGDISLNWIGVVDGARGNGYGSEVLEHLKQVAVAQDFRTISVWKELETGPHELLSAAHRMYLGAGMTDSGEHFSYKHGGQFYQDMWLTGPTS